MNARAAWDRYPALAFAFGDFASFEEACGQKDRDFVVWRDESRAKRNRWLQGMVDEAERRIADGATPLTAFARDRRPATRVGGRLTLWLYGPMQLCCADLVSALQEHADATAIILRCDSVGGELLPAYQLANAIKAHRGFSLAIIDRACWSAAVLPVVSCRRVHMRSTATMLIHQCRWVAEGNCDDIVEALVHLRSLDNEYIKHLLLSRKQLAGHVVRDLHKREEFMGANTALANGFVDSVIKDFEMIAGIDKAPAGNSLVSPI